MAVGRTVWRPLTREWYSLVVALIYSTVACSLAANDAGDDSSASTMQQRIASLFRDARVQPEDESTPQEPDLAPLAELESLLSEPVLVPGPPPATLTSIQYASDVPEQEYEVPRRTPAAVTRIDAETIWQTGARSMDELFDIYVPNVQWIRHHAQRHIGIRGIISDKDDKYLFRVNNRLMNNRSQVGVIAERDLPLLGDIHHIDFIRGLGSATYGPGAISGVVNLVTHTGLTFEGTDATVRGGLIEYFTSVEVRHGRRFSDDSGLFVYYGYADYPGAAQEASPYVFGRTFTARDDVPVVAGQPVTFGIVNDKRAFRSSGRHKLHLQYTKGDFDVWFRWTRGGVQTPPRRFVIAEQPLGIYDPLDPNRDSFGDLTTQQLGYEQYTVFADHTLHMTDRFKIDLALSFDSHDLQRRDITGGGVFHREDEYVTRVVASYTLDRQSFALGFRYSHERFGLPSLGFPDQRARVPIIGETDPWTTDTYSVFGEYQFRLGEQLTGFLSGRMDKHTYTQWLFSPRAAVVYTPNECDTFKVIAAESVRRVEDVVLRAAALSGTDFEERETIKSLELRYERQQTQNLSLGLSGFYEDTGAVTFARLVGEVDGRSREIGEFQIWGVELEASYRTDKTHIQFSQAYTELDDGRLENLEFVQGVSAKPYNDVVPGRPFGNHLANWSPHLTKLFVSRELDDCWTASGSLRVYWGFPGAEDLTNYNNFLLATTGTPSSGLGLSDPGYKKAFRGNYYLDFALQRQILCDRGVIRLDFYNVLGWIDTDLNKRNYLNRLSEYRSEAAAIAVSARLKY